MMRRLVLLPFLALVLALAGNPAWADTRSDAVDKLFARWNSSTTPGANVLVLKDGQELYAASYGMANLELSRRNTPELVYPIGSLSKQFTAYGIQLLVQEGKLALSDDVRRHVPELHDFGTPITIAMLMTHTSGLRDNINLLVLKGRRIDDVVPMKETLDVILAQRSLNYPPGSRYLYSNANYVLLARVIERVSGLSYADFLQQRVFSPLGLAHSRVVADPVAHTPGAANGYEGSANRPQPRMDSTYGSNGILSTLGDLGRWSTYFHQGAGAVFAAMQQPGALNDGLPITYNSGLHLESFRGLPYVEHTGAVVGFRSDILVFPQQRLSVIVLANTGQIDAGQMAFAIAAIYLADEARTPAVPVAAPRQPGAEILRRYVGSYETVSGTSQIAPGRTYRFLVEGDGLQLAEGNNRLVAVSEREFFSSTTGFRVSFAPGARPGAPWAAIIHDRSGTDFAARLVTQAVAKPDPELPLGTLAGLYYSEELNTAYRIHLRGEALVLEMPRGDVPLQRETGNHFGTNGNFDIGTLAGTIAFTHQNGAPDGFLLTVRGGRASNVRFVRLRGDAVR
jgi:CubicO group peptidase (beta-lactamase class C family)